MIFSIISLPGSKMNRKIGNDYYNLLALALGGKMANKA